MFKRKIPGPDFSGGNQNMVNFILHFVLYANKKKGSFRERK